MVKVGSARIDENGKAYGGKAGDQNGKEVSTQDWYLHSKGWVVLRPKDSTAAEKIAYAMQRACDNNHIGYDQYQRDTLYNQAKKVGFDPGKVTVDCETDCSALVRVCCMYAGIDVGNIRTINEPAALVKTGKFEKLTDKKYTNSSDYLKRGDVLCTPVSGHTVVVLSNGAKVAATTTTGGTTSGSTTTTKTVAASKVATKFSGSVAGTYQTTANLNIRDGAGTGNKSLGVLPKGTTVKCYGFYTPVVLTKWLYVVATADGINYTGFCSSSYLKKV